jgi:hypothetical protein
VALWVLGTDQKIFSRAKDQYTLAGKPPADAICLEMPDGSWSEPIVTEHGFRLIPPGNPARTQREGRCDDLWAAGVVPEANGARRAIMGLKVSELGFVAMPTRIDRVLNPEEFGEVYRTRHLPVIGETGMAA